jgi:ribosomal protein S18 acetylase RimI-like enzyme
MSLTIRALAPADSIDDLTELLHRAYADLAARGLRYLASQQDAATTRARIDGGECLLAVDDDGTVVGTITWHGADTTGYAPAYESDTENARLANFQQFAVQPTHRDCGIGRALLDEVERRARAAGATEIVCDTAEPATDLVAMYEHFGYRIVARADWDVTNYASVILSKPLA